MNDVPITQQRDDQYDERNQRQTDALGAPDTLLVFVGNDAHEGIVIQKGVRHWVLGIGC